MHPKITVAAATTLIFLRLLTQEKFHSFTVSHELAWPPWNIQMLQRQLHNLSEAKETACCWFYMWFTDAFLLLRTQRSRVCACICACVCLGGHVLGHVFLMSRCKSLVLFVGNSQLNIQTAESCGVSVNVFNEKFPWLAHIDKQAGAAGVRLLLKQGSGRESETLTSLILSCAWK